MQKISLSGIWAMREAGGGEQIEAKLPGCNYLALLEAGKIDDPYWEMNEEKYTGISEKDWEYSRSFLVGEEILACKNIELVIRGLDTLTEIYLNGALLAKTDNAHRTWRFSVKDRLGVGENEIRIVFLSPNELLRSKNQEAPLFGGLGIPGLSYLRKPQYNYGWDWGPSLSPVGIFGEIDLEGFDGAGLLDVRVTQRHEKGKVFLTVAVDGDSEAQLISPTGETLARGVKTPAEIEIAAPRLWWSNGLGEQPLYTLRVCSGKGEVWEKKIGLRTIELNTEADQWGNNFCFKVNGVPIFAKGADWIPSDSFVTRTTYAELEFYISHAKAANMNMLRVWGGGYYETDDFYDLCDKYGILVWQDCAFACAEYPLMDAAFLQSVQEEIRDNVRRLRHHASLALWCGNNEIQVMQLGFRKKKESIAQHNQFFFETLGSWVKESDAVTPYWASSPSSGLPSRAANSFDHGDTHLWQVWHGMMPLEAFCKYPTRFCSEFGMESLPHRRTIGAFTQKENPGLFDPVMLLHQKSKMGNEKILFYMLSKFRSPKKVEDFIYCSQLIQSETVRMATECWRRNMERSHGSLYWQYNDCWPTASWASVDYCKRYKALQYRARHFFAPVMVSADMGADSGEIFVINDLPQVFSGRLEWSLKDFSGKVMDAGSEAVSLGAVSTKSVKTVAYKNKKESVLSLSLFDREGKLISQQSNLLVPDKKAALKKPRYTVHVRAQNDLACIEIQTDSFARYLFVDSDLVETPFSDNYFDLCPGETKELQVALPKGVTLQDLEKSLRLKSLADVEPAGSLWEDKKKRLSLRLNKTNLISWVLFKFLK